MPPLITPSGARKRTADGSAHIAHRCAFSVLQRLADSSIIEGLARRMEHTKLNKERGSFSNNDAAAASARTADLSTAL
jgi:hypothetical protein